MAMKRALSAVALVASAALLAACSGNGDSNGSSSSSGGAAGNSVTLTWWHNSNNDPGKSYYEKVVKDYEAEHSNVKIEITALQHEDMLTKLDAAFQTGDAPSVYMERGGGELAAHVKAGLTMDLTDVAKDAITKVGGSVAGWQNEGKTYALPFSVGVVGFWYNKALFEQAGITAAPKTQDELNEAVTKLKAAGIAPISVGAGDKWPAAHYWYYYVVRECAQDVVNAAVNSHDFSDACFAKAGEDLEKFVATQPFNDGFLATPAQTGATSASGLLATGKAAMELAGHWEPGVMQGLTEDKKGLGDDTGWFPFPSVKDGKGDPAAALGGGDAWACSAGAPPECADFISYLLSDKVQTGFAENDMGLPTNSAASGSVKDPVLADLLKFRDAAPYVQLYLDTAFGENIGGAMNDAIALIFAGQGSPQGVVDAMTQAAKNE
jgi:raffinose/stachyose/melibiose transport system substrate-binding protein